MALTAQSHFFCPVCGVSALHLCYVDESGTSDVPGNTSHFVLAGVSIPIWHWRQADREISAIKAQYSLQEAEIHTAWLLRKYLEQSRIADFERLSRDQRRAAVTSARTAHLLHLQRQNRHKAYRQSKKNYAQTERLTFISPYPNGNASSMMLPIVFLAGVLLVCLPNVLTRYTLTRRSPVYRWTNRPLNSSFLASNAIFKILMGPMTNELSAF